ncbi:hypothetical protein LG003_15155 [Photorhabdus kleinii]|uniref:hypothetical protein n=1 Tax=Photorhabdus kleinii TaxID=768034 RepID=UPI0021D4FCCE|nr:hypothetical protein [Photorhabdus kleinii]MCT8344141.1 hypothetical protein [Photorhabdus kleinii]
MAMVPLGKIMTGLAGWAVFVIQPVYADDKPLFKRVAVGIAVTGYPRTDPDVRY